MRRSKGFMKDKFQSISLYKPTSSSTTTTKLKPSSTPLASLDQDSSKNSLSAHAQPQSKQKPVVQPPWVTGFHHPQSRVAFTVNQDQLLPQPTQRVSIQVMHENSNNNTACESSSTYAYKIVDHPVDENVDLKAAHYISTVKERFRLPLLS